MIFVLSVTTAARNALMPQTLHAHHVIQQCIEHTIALQIRVPVILITMMSVMHSVFNVIELVLIAMVQTLRTVHYVVVCGIVQNFRHRVALAIRDTMMMVRIIYVQHAMENVKAA